MSTCPSPWPPLSFLEKLFGELHSSVLLFDQASQLIYLNPPAEALLELSLPLFQGKKLPATLDFAEEITKALEASLQSGQSFKFLESQLRVKGRAIPVHAELAPLGTAPHHAGSLLWLSPMARLSALKEQEKIQEGLAMMESLILGLAHEIRNPLGAIRAAAERLAQYLPADKGHYSPLIISEVDRLNQLLSQLMHMNRPKKLKHQSLNLNQVLDQVLKLFEAQCEKLNIKIVKNLDPSLPPISASPESLQQVFTNLLKNALEAMETAGGQITVQSQYHHHHPQMGGATLELAFQDSGPGLSEEALAKLFTPFYTSKVQGTGLGLVSSQHLLQAQGGLLQGQNQPGQGAQFRILLPLKNPKNYKK